MRKYIYLNILAISLILLFNLNFVLSEEFGYNLLEEGEGLNPSSSNTTINSSEYWNNLHSPADINLTDLGDVNEPAPADNEVLTWDASITQWVGKTISALSKWIISTTPSSNRYLYNDSDTLYFNETALNATIDLRATGGTGESIWTNDSGTTELITPQDVDLQAKNINNVSNITLGGYIKDSESDSRAYFNENGTFIIEG